MRTASARIKDGFAAPIRENAMRHVPIERCGRKQPEE